MFTGLIQNLGEVVGHEIKGDHSILSIRVHLFLRLFEVGESIAVNGVCLTAVKGELDTFTAEISPETLSRTNLRSLRPKDLVNIEFPLTPAQPIGGHFVQGHVDGVGEILAIEELQNYRRILISYPIALAAFFIEKGSVAVDGVSLPYHKLCAKTAPNL
jgi:riboflavin synthase